MFEVRMAEAQGPELVAWRLGKFLLELLDGLQRYCATAEDRFSDASRFGEAGTYVGRELGER